MYLPTSISLNSYVPVEEELDESNGVGKVDEELVIWSAVKSM